MRKTHQGESPLVREDERLKALDWPSLGPIESPRIHRNDLLLQCSGFEDRSTHALASLQDAGSECSSLGLIDYLPRYQENRGDELRRVAQRAGLSVRNLTYDRRDPAGIGPELLSLCQSAERIFVDISGMSRLLIVQALVALIRSGSHPVSILYTEAEQYLPTRSIFEEDQESQEILSEGVSYLTSGIFEVAATPELSSVAMVGEPIRLIAFPSFDPSQLKNLFEELQPTYTELVHGAPPRQGNAWRRDAIRKLNASVLRELRETDEHVVSTFDYRETLHLLLDSYAKRSVFDRIVVAPTGSKMQAAAVGLVRAALTDVQIVYPTPHRFKEPRRHTIGARQLYQVDLPMETFGGRRTGVGGPGPQGRGGPEGELTASSLSAG